MDAVIARSAAGAVQALRDLSETTGNSRVVLAASMPKPDKAAPPTAATPSQSVGARAGTLGVSAVQQESTVMAPRSSGVVASGGLLSTPPAGLERLITVRWTGELEELLAHIAREAGWNIGPATGLRVTPVIISISAENRSAFDVLRDVGAIAGTAAEVHVSAPSRTIAVRYPKR